MATSSFLTTLLITIILYEGEMLTLALASDGHTKSPTQGIPLKTNQSTIPTNPILTNSPTTPSTQTNTTWTSTTTTSTSTTTTSTPTTTSPTLNTLSAAMSNLSTKLELIKINCSTDPVPQATLITLMEIISNLSATLELIKCPPNTLPLTTPNVTNTSPPIAQSTILQEGKNPKDPDSLKPSETSPQTTGTGGSGFYGPTRFLLISSIVIATLVVGYLAWYNRQHLCGLYRRCKKRLQAKDRDVKGSYKRVPVVVDKQDMEHAQSYVY